MTLQTSDRDRTERVLLEPSIEGHAAPPSEAESRNQHPDQKREGHEELQAGLLRRHPFLFVLGGLALTVAAAGGYLYLDYVSHFESTDDAFVAARQFGIAPKVSGYLTAVPVTDNQHVGANDVIARIDQHDYRVALAQAEAQIAAAKASIRNVDAQLSVQQAQVAASRAQVRQSEAKLMFAQQSSVRYGTLAKEGWSSQQTGELAESNLYQQQAAVATAQSNVKVAQRQVEALKAQRENAVASLKQSRAQRDQAKLNLSYTTVTAAQPGRVVQLSGAVGELAQAGTNLAMFVPDQTWIVANFKESQIDAVRPGDPATIEIDAYPEREIYGHVASVQPGSGTAFSLLPAENATGNYVKIVQRVPVKVVMDDPPTDVALGPGMSVVPTVRVDAAPSLYEQLRAWI
jgi:membrane fusion protein (multidrug efflux system)